jgi:hypothetical protein
LIDGVEDVRIDGYWDEDFVGSVDGNLDLVFTGFPVGVNEGVTEGLLVGILVLIPGFREGFNDGMSVFWSWGVIVFVETGMSDGEL